MADQHLGPGFWDGRTIIETERLKLRTFKPADLPLFASLHANVEVMQFLGGTPIGQSITDGIAAGAQRAFAANGLGKIAVERRSDGAFLGMCGLSVEHWYPDDIEVGWRLARQYWGEGYATEAGAAWIEHAFDAMGAARVISVTDVPNLHSIAVMKRLGMRLDHHAELDDESGIFPAVIYSIGLDEYRAARSKAKLAP